MVTYIYLAVIWLMFIVDYLVLPPKGVKRWGFRYLVLGKEGGTELINKQATPFNQALCLTTSKIKKGQLWRLVSSALLHGGLCHITANSLALWFAGRFVEQQLGPWKYLLTLLVGAVMANLWGMRVFSNEFGFGASTAIYGMIGILAAMFLLNPQLMLAFSWPARIYMLLYLLSNALPDKWSLVEHGGAFIAGLGLAFVLL